MSPDLIYRPPPDLDTNFDRLRRSLNHEHGLSLKSYHDLHQFSVDRQNDFWMSLWKYLDIKASVQPTRAVDESLAIDQFPQFFEGARLNYAENLLARDDESIAIKYISEESLWKSRDITWTELRETVRKLANALKGAQIQKGDIVCIIGSSSPQSLALQLAVASIGAVFSGFAPDAGERVLLDRIGQLSPKLVFSQTAYRYNGRRWDISDRVTKVFSAIRTAHGARLVSTSSDTPDGWLSLDEFHQRGSDEMLTFEQLPFNYPLLVAFSSGTTGTPKGIIHSHGGLVINGKKESHLHNDFDHDDVYYHYSGIGWILWNIMISALFCGSTIVLYDGSPFYPSPEDQLQAVFATGVTAFGAGPRYFAEIRKAGVRPKPYAEKLKCILSAGAILTESLSKWLAEAFGPVCQMSFSGGTELAGNFIAGNIAMPTYAGEMAVKALGMDIDVLDSTGSSVQPGVSGELVCKKPFPNMPIGLWNDPSKKRYYDSYFSTYPHVWHHGDFIIMNPGTKGWTILGRSDGVLNPSGIRFGTAEIYMILERNFADQVLDAICVGQQRPADETERVFLFVRCAKNVDYWSLEKNIRSQVANDLSRRHVPQFIFPTREIPYNVNNKKLEIPLKKVISGGEKALAELTCSVEEKAVLGKYLPYFEIERLLASELEQPRARL